MIEFFETDDPRDRLVVLADDAAEASRDVHVGGLQQSCDVEATERAGRVAHQPAVVDVVGLEELGHPAPAGAGTAAPSSRSDIASTSDTGGRQLKTPAGWPSVSGVPAPHMPRT